MEGRDDGTTGSKLLLTEEREIEKVDVDEVDSVDAGRGTGRGAETGPGKSCDFWLSVWETEESTGSR